MSDDPTTHAIGDQLLKDKFLREIEALPRGLLQKIATDAKVAHARQTLEAAGVATADAETAPSGVKPGIKTSEGWLSYIVTLLGGVLAYWGASKGNELIAMIGSLLAGGTTIGYQFNRTKAKQ